MDVFFFFFVAGLANNFIQISILSYFKYSFCFFLADHAVYPPYDTTYLLAQVFFRVVWVQEKINICILHILYIFDVEKRGQDIMKTFFFC